VLRGQAEPPKRGAAVADEAHVRTFVAALAAGAQGFEGRGDQDEAIKQLQKAALLADSLGDSTLVGGLLVQCSEIFCSIGELRMALRFLERARDMARGVVSEELKGEVYRGYGVLYKARGDLGSAAVSFDRALEKLELTSRHRSLRRALVDLCEIYLKQGGTAEASNLLERAGHLPTEADPSLEVRIRLNRGRLAHLEGNASKALSEYEGAAASPSRRTGPSNARSWRLGSRSSMFGVDASTSP